jgi:hypothetical protein
MIVETGISLLIVLSGLLRQTDVFENIETIILAVAGIFSLLLLALSISAYRKTGLKKIIYAASAFALFAVQLLFESLEETFEVLDTGMVL